MQLLAIYIIIYIIAQVDYKLCSVVGVFSQQCCKAIHVSGLRHSFTTCLCGNTKEVCCIVDFPLEVLHECVHN